MSKKKKKRIDNKLLSKLERERREDYKRAKDNLANIDKPRKQIAKSFIAKFDGDECPQCFVHISAGDTVRYDDDGFLRHASHKSKEIVYEFCPSRFLTLPCECE